MNFKIFERILFCSLAAISLTLWTACTVKNADEEIIMPCIDGNCGNQGNQENRNLSDAEQEMFDNYYLLSVYYINAEKKLGDIDQYIGYGEKNGYSPDYYEYPDIYYMYGQMGDLYTRYFGPYYASKYDFDSATDPIYNLAVGLDSANSKLVITHVYPNGPGSKAGLKEGDTVLYVGASAPGDINGFNRLTSGKDGDEIKLTVSRGTDTLDILAQLFCYLEPTVSISYKDSIPVIKVTGFETYSAMSCADANNTNSPKGTKDEIKDMLSKTSGPTVIDLRGNPGGSIPQCVAAAEQFLSKGDTIAIFESTDLAPDSISQMIITERVVATEDGAGKGRYFVFLADTASASCTEIMLVGITQNLKSPIVGMRTYGKAIGQYYIPTFVGGYAIITSMRFNDKDFFFYLDKGLLPDYEILDPVKALDKAIELAKGGKEKRTKGYGTEDQGHFGNSFNKTAATRSGLPKGGAYRIIRNPRIK